MEVDGQSANENEWKKSKSFARIEVALITDKGGNGFRRSSVRLVYLTYLPVILGIQLYQHGMSGQGGHLSKGTRYL